MAKEGNKTTDKKKVRADKYEEKVKFEGTLEQMIEIAGKTKLTKGK